MAYGQDLAGSAKRHLEAAGHLMTVAKPGAAPGNTAVAGYLYGLAGELAFKQRMVEAGIRPGQSHAADPFYAHFPELKSLFIESAKGRLAQPLLKHAANPRLFQEWNTRMRYAPTTDVLSKWTQVWKGQAEQLVSEMGT